MTDVTDETYFLKRVSEHVKDKFNIDLNDLPKIKKHWDSVQVNTDKRLEEATPDVKKYIAENSQKLDSSILVSIENELSNSDSFCAPNCLILASHMQRDLELTRKEFSDYKNKMENNETTKVNKGLNTKQERNMQTKQRGFSETFSRTMQTANGNGIDGATGAMLSSTTDMAAIMAEAKAKKQRLDK